MPDQNELTDEELEREFQETEDLLADQDLAEIKAAALRALEEEEEASADDGEDELDTPVVRQVANKLRKRLQRPTVSKARRGTRGERWRRGTPKVYQGGIVEIDGDEYAVAGVRSNGVINLESGDLYYPDEYVVVQERPDMIDEGRGGQ